MGRYLALLLVPCITVGYLYLASAEPISGADSSTTAKCSEWAPIVESRGPQGLVVDHDTDAKVASKVLSDASLDWCWYAAGSVLAKVGGADQVYRLIHFIEDEYSGKVSGAQFEAFVMAHNWIGYLGWRFAETKESQAAFDYLRNNSSPENASHRRFKWQIWERASTAFTHKQLVSAAIGGVALIGSPQSGAFVADLQKDERFSMGVRSGAMKIWQGSHKRTMQRGTH